MLLEALSYFVIYGAILTTLAAVMKWQGLLDTVSVMVVIALIALSVVATL